MNIVIVYDSAYGNTAQVAGVIEKGLGSQVQTVSLHVSDAGHDVLSGKDMLIIGSPTQGGKATKPIQDFIKRLPNLNGMKVAAFDTRFAANEQNAWLRLVMKLMGYAADKTAKTLKKHGGQLVVGPEGFIVTGKEGPIKEGELERADEWALAILHSI